MIRKVHFFWGNELTKQLLSKYKGRASSFHRNVSEAATRFGYKVSNFGVLWI